MKTFVIHYKERGEPRIRRVADFMDVARFLIYEKRDPDIEYEGYEEEEDDEDD